MKSNETKDLKSKIEQLNEENSILKKRLEKLNEDFEYANRLYQKELEKISFERFARLNYKFIRTNGITKYICAVFKSLWKVTKLALKKVFNKIKRKILPNPHKKVLKNIISEHNNMRIMVFYPGYDWYMKMYQRPQHMAIHFSERDTLFFYCTLNINDNVNGFEQINDNLYVTDQFELLKKYLPKFTLYMCANMNGCYLDELQAIENKGNDILYEYIDDLHDDLTDISHELIKRHEYVLKKKSIPVVATAQHLFNKAKKIRGNQENLLLSTNGVVYEDFHITKKLPVPVKIKTIVSEGKPIIGYYGALAKWFDYDLIEKIAKQHKDWNILLIGIDYDNSFAKYDYFNYLDNVYYIGIVEYKELVKYGNCCSVLTIPFVINEITLSTSPVKVFEYMSMEKPIVTTDLPECRKYESVLISKSHQEFIKNLEKGISLQNDDKYRDLLRKEALENTWDNKVDEILNFIKKS